MRNTTVIAAILCQAVCVDDVITKACMCGESIKDVTRQPFLLLIRKERETAYRHKLYGESAARVFPNPPWHPSPASNIQPNAKQPNSTSPEQALFEVLSRVPNYSRDTRWLAVRRYSKKCRKGISVQIPWAKIYSLSVGMFRLRHFIEEKGHVHYPLGYLPGWSSPDKSTVAGALHFHSAHGRKFKSERRRDARLQAYMYMLVFTYHQRVGVITYKKCLTPRRKRCFERRIYSNIKYTVVGWSVALRPQKP